MIRALLSVRFRALSAAMLNRGQKKRGAGTVVLFVILYLYLLAVIAGAMCWTFFSLAQPYHAMGLDWLYFAMAGLMGLGFAVLGSVFTTQSQLYEAKDNELLLAMPVTPRAILFSRLIPLLGLNLLFAGLVMVPAIAMYAIFVEFSAAGILIQLLTLLAVCFLAQAVACLLGWLLHLLLSKLNKSVASVLYMAVFLGVYFYVYSQANKILQAMAANGAQIAQALRAWVWPLYAMGEGCLGSALHLLAFLAIAAAIFGIVYVVLSRTFLNTVTAKRSSRRARKLDVSRSEQKDPIQAVVGKEWRKFLGSPVYLTNMGLGVLLMAVLPVAGLALRKMIMGVLAELELMDWAPVLIWAMLAFTVSTACISTPSVSLEGKNIWILKSMPIASKDILLAKLALHCRITVPVVAAAALILSAAFQCSIWDALLVTAASGLFAVFSGLFGLWAGLIWAKLDYVSEAYPCKQSMSVFVSMFGAMGIPMAAGLLYLLLARDVLTQTGFLGIYSALLVAACAGFYRIMITWGVKKWEAL